jgi:dipeptidase E
VQAVKSAQAIFIGGGNTFLLLKTLYDQHLVEAIRSRVLEDGIPYIGSSAGTNVATASINTTNDMPIILPPTFYALQLTPFNINPHYLDPEPSGTHKGETREQRIEEFHHLNSNPVLGLREGSALLVDGDSATLVGHTPARFFQRGQPPHEFPVGTDFSFLFQ